MYTLKATLVGSSPLMMHNERLANPRDEHTRALKLLTKQRQKTDEIVDEIARKEWEGGLYEVDGAPVIPSDNVLACLKEGARKRKLGKQADAGVFAPVPHFALDYDGPKGIQALWDDGRFFDFRGVVVGQVRVMRSRPIFREWSLPIELHADGDVFAPSDAIMALRTAGAIVGLCEKRPQFGRFAVTQEEIG